MRNLSDLIIKLSNFINITYWWIPSMIAEFSVEFFC